MTPRERHQARFREVLDFIDAHLDTQLDVDTLSRVARFSKYHFLRQFTELFGVGAYRYVLLKRLKRASYELAFRPERLVIDVALASGFESAEAFARAFRKHLGQSPSEFRRDPEWQTWHSVYEPLIALRMTPMQIRHRLEDVRIVDFPATHVAALEHRGDPKAMGDSVRKFIAWRKQNQLPATVSATFNVVHDHPEEGDCHYDLCAGTERAVPPNEAGVVAKTIPAGRTAVLRHTGPEDTLAQSVHYLYTEWLPDSGEEPRDFPLFFQRVRFFPDVPEHEAVTDIFLPIK